MPEFAAFEETRPAGPRPSVLVRDATPLDAPAIAALSAAREGLDVADVLPRVRRELEAAVLNPARFRRFCRVALVDGTIVGYGRAAWMDYAADASARNAPSGWYLTGLVVAPAQRRGGVGEALTRSRLDSLASEVRYFATAKNLVTIALHAKLGFVEETRDFAVPGATFDGGVGVLFVKRRY